MYKHKICTLYEQKKIRWSLIRDVYKYRYVDGDKGIDADAEKDKDAYKDVNTVAYGETWKYR